MDVPKRSDDISRESGFMNAFRGKFRVVKRTLVKLVTSMVGPFVAWRLGSDQNDSFPQEDLIISEMSP